MGSPFGEARMATCHIDDEPLVMTFAFRGKEFICMSCGSRYTYFGPKPAGETPELDARHDVLKAQWEELSDGLISSGAMYESCATCKASHQIHLAHATPEEVIAHNSALQRIRARFPEREGQ